MKDSSSLVTVRLSPDALHLEALLAPETLAVPTDALVALIQEQSAQLGVDLPLTARDLDARRRASRRGAWMTLLSGTAPAPPLDGRVELLVPVPLAAERHLHGRSRRGAADPPSWSGGTRHAVRAGTPLARVKAGSAGAPGYDLLGRTIPARPPREARLPQGENTVPSGDGMVLLAACDGEVLLHNLLIHVAPMLVHDGDLHESDGPLVSDSGVFVRGSVHGARIVAHGEVYVQGDVDEAHISSTAAGITATGSVMGSPQRRAILHARADITCVRALHAELSAGGHLYIVSEARHSLLHAGGNLYLQGAIDQGLVDAQVQVGGGVVPGIDAPAPLVTLPTERQHFRVVTRLPASIALHAATLEFHPCTIVDLSTGGARCRVADPFPEGEPARGAIVQLKFALSEGDDQIVTVARVSRPITPGVIGVSFLQMTDRDHHRLTEFCLQLLMARRHNRLATRTDRT